MLRVNFIFILIGLLAASEAVDYFRKALALHPAGHLAKEGLKRVSENT